MLTVESFPEVFELQTSTYLFCRCKTSWHVFVRRNNKQHSLHVRNATSRFFTQIAVWMVNSFANRMVLAILHSAGGLL